jgi:5-methylcytosine-specific restriction endonuclease McrA
MPRIQQSKRCRNFYRNKKPRFIRATFYTGRTYCCYCGEFLTEENRTVEHLVPASYGGHKKPGNIDAACRLCNSARGNTWDWREFAERRKLLAKKWGIIPMPLNPTKKVETIWKKNNPSLEMM